MNHLVLLYLLNAGSGAGSVVAVTLRAPWWMDLTPGILNLSFIWGRKIDAKLIWKQFTHSLSRNALDRLFRGSRENRLDENLTTFMTFERKIFKKNPNADMKHRSTSAGDESEKTIGMQEVPESTQYV